MPTATSKPSRKKLDRVHPKHAAILLVLEAGKLKDVYFHNASGHVFVADLDALKGLSPEEAASKVLNGVGSITLDHKLFEQELESIFAGPEPVAIPAPADVAEEGPVVNVLAAPEPETAVTATPAPEPVASPVVPSVTDGGIVLGTPGVAKPDDGEVVAVTHQNRETGTLPVPAVILS